MTDNQFCIGRAAGNNDVFSACRQGARKASGHRSCGEKSEEMRLHRKVAVRFVTALAAAMALLLGGCRTDSTFEFKADGSVRTQIVFEDDTDSMRTLKGNCEQLKNYIGPVGQFIVDGKMEDVTPSGGHLTCKITSNTPIERAKFTTEGNSYTLALKPTSETKEDMEGLTAKTTIVMPGKVVKTSIGDVRGNKVVITGVDYLVDGLKITSEKEGSHSPSSNPQSGGLTGKRPSDADNGQGFPPWAWAAGLGGLGLALTGLAVVAARKRRTRNPQANPPGHF